MLTWRDRLHTIVVTAAVTSVFWAVLGLVLYARQVEATPGRSGGLGQEGELRQDRGFREDLGVQQDGRLVVPVQGVRREALVDTWGQSREGGRRAHEAIDILARRGTAVVAAAAGTVEKLFLSVRGGTTLYVRSPDRRRIYYYAHLDGYAPGLRERQQVRAGDLLGYVGSTGDASPEAPHLHFAINLARPDEGWWQGLAINPYPLLRP